MSLNWRNVGPKQPRFETQIQDQIYLADMYLAFHGPVVEDVPFWLEFNMPTGGQGQTNLYQFYFQYNKLDRWTFHFGKFLVPFGRYNELYKPDMFLAVTRPLLYASPDSLDLVVRINSPRPPFSSGYTDIGARASYYPISDLPIVPSELTTYVVNGLGESSNRQRGFPSPQNLGIPAPPANGVAIDFGHENNNLADSNNNKAIGGRVVYSLGSLKLPWPIPERVHGIDGLTMGISAMGGQYDLEGGLGYRMVGTDFAFEYRDITFTAEYQYSWTQFKSPISISSPTVIVPTVFARDYEEINGYFIQGAYPLIRKPTYGKRVTLVGVWNQMFRRGPLLELLLNQSINGTTFPSIAAWNPTEPRLSTRLDKWTVAIHYLLTDNFILKADYSYWLLGSSSSQVGLPNIYQGAFSAVLSF